MRVQEILEGCNERNCMHRSTCLLRKLYQCWTNLLEASKVCGVLLKCECKKYWKDATNEIVCTEVRVCLENCTNAGQQMLAKTIKKAVMTGVF